MERASRKLEVDFAETTSAPVPPAVAQHAKSKKAGRKVTVNFAEQPKAPQFSGVYMRDRTHTYLHLRDGTKYGYFLTMDNGTIEVVRVDLVTVVDQEPVKADKKRGIAAQPGKYHDVYRVWMDREHTFDLVPHAYDFKKAVEKYHSSLIGRTRAAENEMRSILGMPALEIPADTPDTDVIGEQPAPTSAKPTGAVKGHKQPRAERKPKEPREERVKGYTLQELCAELKKDPTEARKALRASKVQKPGGHWEWPSKEAAAAARKVIEAWQGK